ncbi:hypothetical protein HWV07_15430 [Natronomonas salina]|uniref:hypothetical protein n=1 Tax=Natronomonas salina TaxID=1710540 RepID=UPI0015B720A7|nr:hypothetical protein [Natronomonas salina]QLD90351.1 hypothetical protein HWV07_15430 [Natronomonas salina]
MNIETVRTIADRYPWASWAVWDDAFPEDGCIESDPERLVKFVSGNVDDLTSDIVLMGLNRSDDLPAPFANFHTPSRKHFDYRLKEAIQDGGLNRLQGAYMTDLVDEVDPDSNNIAVSDDDATTLVEQLELLDASEYHVVCFGNKPFDGLSQYFSADVTTMPPEMKTATVDITGTTIHLYRVWFYGLYGSLQDKVNTFRQQLRILDEELG